VSSALHGVALALAFALELCALAAFGWWGWHTGDRTASHVLLAIGAPTAGAVLWGLLAAPRAPLRAPVLAVLAEVAFHLAAAGALRATGHPRLAGALLALVVLDSLAVHLLAPAASTGAESAQPSAAGARPGDGHDVLHRSG